MKAMGFTEFGSSDKIKQMDVPLRDLRSGEVQVAIKYTSVNPVDWKIREGYLQDMLPHQMPITSGWDAAGIVSAVAEDVKDWRVGDRVMAYTRLPKVHAGTYAEYINLPSGYLAKLPENLELWQAAALPLVGLTAYQALHTLAKITDQDHVFIPGGNGGVGSLAIQFAKAAGAKVTTTGRKLNHDYLKSLGADETVDYTDEDSTDQLKKIAPDGFDVVLDCAGGDSLAEAWQVIAKNGRLVSIVETPDAEKAGRKDVEATFHFVEPSGTQLSEIATLMEQGKVKLPEINVRSVKEAREAQEENQARRVRGKVVLEIDFS